MFSFGKDPDEKADSDFEKAEQLFDALQYKKAGKYFTSAGENYIEIKDYASAEEAYFKAANSYLQDDRHIDVLDSLRKAADASLHQEKYEYAQTLFNKSLEYLKKLKSSSTREDYYMVLSSLSFLCYFVLGNPDKGLQLLKKIRKMVKDDFFKENPLIHLATNLTIAIRDKKPVYIEKIIEDFKKINLNEIELKLAKIAILLAEIQSNLTPELIFDQKTYTTRELVGIDVKIDGSILETIAKNTFYDYPILEFTISEYRMDQSDNLTIQTKPDLPVSLIPGQTLQFQLVLKPHFQVENCFVGPFKLKCKINHSLLCFIEDKGKHSIELTAPPTYLDVAIKNLKPPLIDQTFPLEILIENNSDGEASNLEIQIELPETLQLRRGTTEKQIYSLRSNENIRWEINARPIEAAESEIKVKLKYEDPDQKVVEETKSFPISIKL
ncbi:MAG: Tetratricopeptide domain protein [Promethearchaeota archaeon]|jgi:tetratricopeptide (TPR) repeat protein|nr:MAG: Tetratricopeptide domain protein [Candidatus Lokiarchaeota archaeon]